MTQRAAGSFLIRIEPGDGDGRAGTVTSVQTGEHASFDGFADLARVLERWVQGGGPRSKEEDTP